MFRGGKSGRLPGEGLQLIVRYQNNWVGLSFGSKKVDRRVGRGYAKGSEGSVNVKTSKAPICSATRNAVFERKQKSSIPLGRIVRRFDDMKIWIRIAFPEMHMKGWTKRRTHGSSRTVLPIPDLQEGRIATGVIDHLLGQGTDKIIKNP